MHCRAQLHEWGLLWTITTVAGGAVWFLDESSYRNLWCIGSSVMATIFPYNILSMMPDANRLLNNTVIKKLGVSWVRTKLDAYDKQHMYRTFVGLFVLGLWLYVMTKP
ncbi:uncharacterized protein LOC134704858 [Mytilus trossulus]|uniref:uncharacterized protein LOC134704858 n=1 Tax=Mytilus trossulus TaxID=6551 RepID=UPI0030048CE0